MVIDNKIERYVHRAVSCLPPYDRAKASKEISEMVRDLVLDYAGDHEPDILDARAVISELGSPEEMAAAWLEQKHDAMEKEAPLRESSFSSAASHLTGRLLGKAKGNRKILPSTALLQKTASIMMAVCTILAVLLVGFGLLGLTTHTINTMLPIFLGCIMALIAVTGRSVLISDYR